MNRWNGCLGISAVIFLAVFLSTVLLAVNGHGNPVVDGTPGAVPPDEVVGTRRAVSPRATVEVAESQTPMFPHSQPTQSPNADKPSPQILDTQSKTQNPPLNPPPAGNTQADHPEIIQKMQKLQMPFIANEGQVDERVAFYAKTFGGTVFVTKDGEIVYSLPSGRDVPGGASQESGRGGSPGSREAEGQGFEGYEPDGRLMGLNMSDSPKGRDTARRVPTVNLCWDTYPRVPTSPIQYLAYVIHSSKGDVLGRIPEKRESRIMDYVSWFEGCVPDGRKMGLRMSDSTKGWDTVPRVPAVVLKEEFVGAKISGITGEGESVTKVSYFKGSDPSKWKSNISTYQLVNLGEIYEGIELKLKAHGNNVEKLLYVRPGVYFNKRNPFPV